jgi:nicotinamidase-related amidase
MLINAHTSSLLIVDIQERLAPHVMAHNALIGNAQTLLKAARRLDVPTLVSEQYPRGLGHTVEDLAPLIDGARTLEKMHFSCLGDATYAEAFHKLGRAQAVIAGMEAHVCVLQTVGDLLRTGTDVFVVADAVSSRTEENYRSGIERMRAMGAEIVTTEMVLFEWLGRAGTPEFKELSPLIR